MYWITSTPSYSLSKTKKSKPTRSFWETFSTVIIFAISVFSPPITTAPSPIAAIHSETNCRFFGSLIAMIPREFIAFGKEYID